MAFSVREINPICSEGAVALHLKPHELQEAVWPRRGVAAALELAARARPGAR